ncbi:MAG TPA: hypothetical protein VEG44_01520 [Candidatus Acidoferrales bacterium]|nr:hypothetical protein [Candidatus Acidoferrales bacterium]
MVQTITQNLDGVNCGSHEELERIKNLILINPQVISFAGMTET